MPWLDYIELANRAMAKYNEQAGITGRRSNFGPIADGTHIPMGGFFANDFLHYQLRIFPES